MTYLKILHQGEMPESMIWYRKKLEGCHCAGGGDYWMYLKKGTTDQLLFFFVGGGFFWNQEMADLPGSLFTTMNNIPAFYTDEAQPNNEFWFFENPGNNGIFSLDQWNAFRDWNMVMVNYGTGDMHIGQSEFNHGNQFLHQHGYDNFKAVLQESPGFFPNPSKLLIAGESAGAFAVPALADDVIQAYRYCKDITVYSDAAVLTNEDWPRIVSEVWHAPSLIADACHSSNIVLDLYQKLHEKYGNTIRYLFSCGIGDEALAALQNYVAWNCFHGSNTARLQTAYAVLHQASQLEQLGFCTYLHCFRNNGSVQHCTLAENSFHAGYVKGISPMVWMLDCLNDNAYSIKEDI